MSDHEPLIYCTNPACANPMNALGKRICDCQTPLTYRYLWATGEAASQIPIGEKVAERYQVTAPQIWLDTLPGLPPEIPQQLPEEIIPYLRLYPQRLHIPEVYGLAIIPDKPEILLLENVPIQNGQLYPAIQNAWHQATAVRQLYWLWQILELWVPMTELGVAANLLVPDNLRVEGWRVRLLEVEDSRHEATLKQLGECWQPWLADAQSSIVQPLTAIITQMCADDVDYHAIAPQLNQLLLATAAELPLRLEVAGATDTGPGRTQNEDSCFPGIGDANEQFKHLTIVCDGIGGHEGGEVASQLAVQSLKLQIRALLTEVAAQTELVPPDLLQDQLAASLRVVNNVICACNDEQKRSDRQRMGTTLVMAVQVAQRVRTTAGWESENGHELYLVNIGDSRAYWITPNYCQQLTVDDDVATREVSFARSLHREALQRPDAGALTQALGTKDAEFLRPVIQRFIIEEDGVLLLCSDGLSDNNWVEQSWQDYIAPVIAGEMPLEDAVRHWLDVANNKNGHDNTSVVLSYCRVSPESPIVYVPKALETIEPELPQSQALVPVEAPFIDLTPEPVIATKVKGKRHRTWLFLGLLALLLGGSAGLLAWRQTNPKGFTQVCKQLPNPLQRICP